MQRSRPSQPDPPQTADPPGVPYAANDVRLSPRQCVIAALIIAGAFFLVPVIWQKIQPLRIGPDYRVPYALGNDYWNYQRTCRRVAAGDETLLLGDSVVWGHYVKTEETLSHYLNELAGAERFANLGVDGIHPVAMAGLVEHYGGAIRGRRVVLNCNLLWMTSPRYDLSTDKESAFNHPGLVPQFYPRIPCYRASVSEKLGIVVGRHVGFFGWADHLRIAYFEGDDLSRWTIEHPYENPAAAVTLELPSPDEPPSPLPDPRPWTEKKDISKEVTPEWVALDESLQWRFFQRTVRLLLDRGNRVFVLLGPMNEHMLTEEGLKGYTERKQQVAAWLAAPEQAVPHYVPAALPSRAYADLSHPTAEGYKLLARQLSEQEAFRAFQSDTEEDR